MAKGRSPWHDGKRAWDRLKAWYEDGSADFGARGEPALDALGDVGTLRRLLDETELAAVRVARLHGKSWAEIATKLGVTRQSAWERWRDVDGQQSAGVSVSRSRGLLSAESQVVVPDVIGLTVEEALRALDIRQLRPAASDPDGLPLSAQSPGAVVTDQSPESGARVPAWSSVRLWLSGGGGEGGVREPRRPKPDPKSGRQLLPEPD